MRTLDVQILTPEAEYWAGQAEHVRVPGTEGSFGILPRHIGLVAALGQGKLEIRSSDGNHNFKISGGLIEVRENTLRVLSDSVEALA